MPGNHSRAGPTVIDDDRARRLTLEAIDTHPSFRIAREHGLNVLDLRDTVVGICEPMVPGTVRKLVRLPVHSRIEYADLVQAGILGLIEAVDSYEPRKVVKHNGKPRFMRLSSHAWWRIRKRVFEEVQETHWMLTRPPRSEVERFMKDEMDDFERAVYINTVLAPFEGRDDDGELRETTSWGMRASMGRDHARRMTGERDG